MLRLRFAIDCQPRTKKGQPAQSTTGVPNSSWSQFEAARGTRCASPSRCPPISSAKTGTVSARPIQNRRVKSTSSGFGPVSAVATSGSSAMPQIGQEPGPTWRTCGCIGQV